MTTPKFKQKNGLTVYAFSCGYIQVAKYTDLNGVESEVTLRHEGGNCYTVRAAQFGGPAKTQYLATESIGTARKFWADNVARLMGDRIKAAKADKRYTVAHEYCGEREPHYVARFGSIASRSNPSWLGKSDTVEGAWLLAAKDQEQRAADIAATVSTEIKRHMAKALFASAWADQAEECGESLHGEIMDQVPHINDPAAIKAAEQLVAEMCTLHGCYQIENVFNRVAVIQRNTGDSGDREVTPEHFGHYCAMQAMGHGVGLYDAFGSEVYNVIKVPNIEFGSHSLAKVYFSECELCDVCQATLEPGQIGKCGDCSDD